MSVYAATKNAVPPAVLDEMCNVLEAMGVHVLQLHTEAGSGQFEIVTAHGPAMQARSCVRASLVSLATDASALARRTPGISWPRCSTHPLRRSAFNDMADVNVRKVCCFPTLRRSSTRCAQEVEHLLLTREAIQGVAFNHGKTATFLPKLSQHDCGNGEHCHWSLQTVRV